MVIHKTLHQKDLNEPVKVCTTSQDLLQLKPMTSTLRPLLERQTPASITLLVLCQPLDKAVYCKLQVSMTWALEHSDKAVTANSELAFSVGNSECQPTRGRVLTLYTPLQCLEEPSTLPEPDL